jgi:hypothetical protein
MGTAVNCLRPAYYDGRNEVCTRKREVAMEGSRSEEAVVEWSKEL